MQPPLSVQVADHGAELHAELGDLDRGQPPLAVRDQAVQALARQRLEHHCELGLAEHLVGANEVRMGEVEQQQALALEPRSAAARGCGSRAAGPWRRTGSRARRSTPRRRRAPGCG